MGNPFKTAQGGAMGQQSGPMGFVQFMQQMRGKDPSEMLNQLVSSGKVNQAQLNQAKQMAQQMAGQFDGFKGMFGF